MALIQGLPSDAAVWRNDAFPAVEERLVEILERNDAWHRAIFAALCHEEKIAVPGEIKIDRPGQPEAPEVKYVERDVNAIARFFALG